MIDLFFKVLTSDLKINFLTATTSHTFNTTITTSSNNNNNRAETLKYLG